MTRRTQNSLLAAPSVNLSTILRGCCPDGNNIMSASQRIPTRNQRTPERAHSWGMREGGEQEEALLLQSCGCWACGENTGTTGDSVAELGCTHSAENSNCRSRVHIGTYCQLLSSTGSKQVCCVQKSMALYEAVVTFQSKRRTHKKYRHYLLFSNFFILSRWSLDLGFSVKNFCS